MKLPRYSISERYRVVEGLNFRFNEAFRVAAADARSQGRFDEFLGAASMHMDAVMNMDI